MSNNWENPLALRYRFVWRKSCRANHQRCRLISISLRLSRVFRAKYLAAKSKYLRPTIMPENADAKKNERSQSSENNKILSIPKQTAGAIAGATVGRVAGPIRRPQNHANGREPGEDRHRRGLLANPLAVAVNGISGSIGKSA
jgi:hypothetical protein